MQITKTNDKYDKILPTLVGSEEDYEVLLFVEK